MTVTASDVRAIATEFAAVLDAVIDPYIAMAERRTFREAWGVKADDGVIFLVAHFLKLSEAQSALSAGPVTSETVGPLSRSYATVGGGTSSDNVLSSTVWGREYIALRQLVFAARVW